MKIEELKEGQIVSVIMTIGYAPNEPEKFVEIEYIIGIVRDIDTPNGLVQIAHSPDVVVSPQYIHGIPISELVIKRLGWNEIDCANLNVAPPILPSVKKAYQRDSKQLYQNYAGEFYFSRSKSTQPSLVAYVHELQNLGIHDLEPSKLLNK